MEYVNILGRLLFGGYFVYGGINHFINLKMLTGYAASKKVPMANIAVMGAGLMLLAGGLSYILNFHVTAGTIILLLFLIPTSFMMHNFWAVADPAMAQTQMMALIGALLLFLSIRYTFGFAL